VEFDILYSRGCDVLELYWHNTPSSIRLWKYLPLTKIVVVDSNDIHIIFLSSDLDTKVILTVVQWYLKREVVSSNRNEKANGINDSVKATISLIIKVETLKGSQSLKTLVEGIRGLEINCEIKVILP
jgi:hypothetical protein